MYEYFEKLGLFEKTGVDLPGEAASIMHKIENVGAVELATISFGQSFQITPLQLLRAVSAVINGGNLVTPHFGMYTTDAGGNKKTVFDYPVKSGAISRETSETMKELLGLVVSEGTGKNGQVAGYAVGGKNRNFPEASERIRKIHCFVYRVFSGGKSSDHRYYSHR